MNCKCGHDSYDHGSYEYLPRLSDPQAKLTRVSERCTATIYKSESGDDFGRKCECYRFEEAEGSSEQLERDARADRRE